VYSSNSIDVSRYRSIIELGRGGSGGEVGEEGHFVSKLINLIGITNE